MLTETPSAASLDCTRSSASPLSPIAARKAVAKSTPLDVGGVSAVR